MFANPRHALPVDHHPVVDVVPQPGEDPVEKGDETLFVISGDLSQVFAGLLEQGRAVLFAAAANSSIRRSSRGCFRIIPTIS
jgi:hypothetical protein